MIEKRIEDLERQVKELRSDLETFETVLDALIGKPLQISGKRFRVVIESYPQEETYSDISPPNITEDDAYD